MSKQEKKQDKRTAEGQEKKQQRKERVECLNIPYFVVQQARRERLSGEQILAYGWIYGHNLKAKNKGGVYGKPTYNRLCEEMHNDLGIVDTVKVCRKLERKGWIRQTVATAYKGVRMVGYLCMLDKEQAVRAKAGEQQELLPMEETVVEVSAEVQGSEDMGERYQWGQRMYLLWDEEKGAFDEGQIAQREDGGIVTVPLTAPVRPTRTAVWVDDPEGWFEPEEIPERESEF